MKRPPVEPTARAKTTDRAARWTPSQERAIAVRGKDVLVSAAAGSGKTSVLVERILRRLLDPDDPVDVDRLLVVTFTEAAASEMRERLHLALSQAADAGNPRAKGQLLLLGKASISTLHSFCLQLVRRHAYLVDIDPRFRVLDPEEAGLLKVEAMDELFESLHQDPEEYAPLLEHYAGKRDDRELRALVLALFEYVESLPDPEAWLDRAARSYDPREPESASAFQRWREALLAEARAEVERALFSLALGDRYRPVTGGARGVSRVLSDDSRQLATRAAISWPRAGGTRLPSPSRPSTFPGSRRGAGRILCCARRQERQETRPRRSSMTSTRGFSAGVWRPITRTSRALSRW